MEPADNQQIRRETIQAPSSLLERLEARLQARRVFLSTSMTLQECIIALEHPHWERRSAAVEMLGTYNLESVLKPLLGALHDESPFVRISAISVLGKRGGDLALDYLLPCLQDEDWQVCEIAALTLGKLRQPGVANSLEVTRSESNSKRSAATHLVLPANTLREKMQFLPMIFTRLFPKGTNSQTDEEMKGKTMSITHLFNTKASHTVKESEQVSSTPCRQHWQKRAGLGLLAAVVLVALTAAAGLNYGWWNLSFGDYNLYQNIQQQQTDQGVTVVVTRAYADEGRTVIAYDTFAANHDQSRQFFPDHYVLQGSVPARHNSLDETFGDSMQQGVTHFYMVLPAFQVPANMNSIMVTWDIGRMLVSQPGKGSVPTLSGHWHFSFTVPFHHTNNQQLPDPRPGQIFHRI